MTTKQELIDQMDAQRQRCESARDQLWQRYLVSSDQYLLKLSGDFAGLLNEIGVHQDVMAQFPESPLLKSDQELYNWNQKRLGQLFDRVRDAGIELPVLALTQ